MKTLTLTLSHVASLKSQIDGGKHLHALFAINEYIEQDRVMALALITYLRREAEERAPHKLMLIDTFKELPLLTLAEEDRIRVTELLSLEGAVTPKPFWMARAIRVEGRTTAQRSSLCRQRGTAARLRKPARVVHRYTPSVTPKSRPVLIRVLDNSPRVTIHPKNCRRAFSESSKRNHQGLSGF